MEKISEKTKKLRTEYLERFDSQKHNELFYREISKQVEDSLMLPYEATKEHYEANCKPGEKLKLLDFGCASNPTHVAAAVASQVPLEIVMSDFLPQNRERLQTWINGQEFKIFEHHFGFISKVSGISSDEIKKKTRESITKVESYDLFQDLSRDYGMYDVIISSYAVECASTCQEEYEKHMKKVVGLLSKGGTLVMTGSLGETSYTIGEAFLQVFPLTEDFLRKLIPSLGLKLQRLEINARDEIFSKTADYDKNFNFVAKKMI